MSQGFPSHSQRSPGDLARHDHNNDNDPSRPGATTRLSDIEFGSDPFENEFFDSPDIQQALFNDEPSLFVQSMQSPPSNQQARRRQRPSFYDSDASSDLFDFSAFDASSSHSITTLGNQQSAYQSSRESSVVDLTSSPSSPSMATNLRKRKPTTAQDAPAPKIRRVSTSSSRQSISSGSLSKRSKNAKAITAGGSKVESPEVVDLSAIEDEEQFEEFKKKQQAALAKQQQQDEAVRPVKLAEYQCIICMDGPTDLVITHCGHLFCSECLHQALWTVTAKKSCPICRAAIVLPKAGTKKIPKNSIFQLEMKFMTARKKGKQPDRNV